MSKRYGRVAPFFGALAVLWAAALPPAALAQSAGVNPDAAEILKSATSFLAQQKRFSVATESTVEAVLTSGQKLQFGHTVTVSVQRPDKLRAERHGDLVDQVFYYDGKMLTLHNPGDKYYATIPAPATLDEALDFAREKLDILAPAADLVYTNAYEILTQDVTEGFVVGVTAVEGVPCYHLAFRGPQVDWQIWIQEGDQPLPRKLVITSTDVLNAPQFEVVMTQWNLAPELSDQTFAFTPPDGATKVEFIVKGQSASQSN